MANADDSGFSDFKRASGRSHPGIVSVDSRASRQTKRHGAIDIPTVNLQKRLSLPIRYGRTNVSFVLRALVAALAATAGSAHELALNMRLASPAVVVRAAYGGTEPLPFAKVQVFTAAGKSFQSGVTDSRGQFAFVPDAAGDWRLVVDDETGHRAEIKIPVSDTFLAGASSASAATSVSRVERALIGIALILGIAGLLYGYRSRRTPVT